MKFKKYRTEFKDAKEIWEKGKFCDFSLLRFSTFEDYWKECERMNNLSDEEWEKLLKENKQKIAKIKN